MQEFPINYLALIVAALIRAAVGMAWHSPIMFGPAWMKLVGVNDQDMKAMLPRAIPIDLIGGFVMAFVLVHAVHYAGANTLATGAAVGFFNWIGFLVVSNLAGVLYEKKPFKLFAIDISGQLVALVAMGALLAVWI